MHRLFVAVVFLLSAVASAQPTPSAPTTSAWNPKEFPISFWCAPDAENTNLERYQQIKDAGFTFVMPPCSGATVQNNHKILDLCQQVGLKAFIQDSRVVLAGKGKGKVEDVDAAVKEYASHPALAGYMVDDEPLASAFPQLAAVVNRLREKDPAHVAFINLFPNIVAPNLLKAKSYDDYLRTFVRTVKPFTLSYDHYSLQKKGDDKLFIANLAAARTVALDEHVPFWNIVQVTQWGAMRNLAEGELEYQAMQSLAMGAKGLLWFTYWTPTHDHSQAWTHAMINADGKPDAHYEMVKRVNARLLAIGNELLHATSAGFFQTGKVPAGGLAAAKDAPVSFEGDAPPITVGWFETPNHGRLVLFASGDYKHALDFHASIDGSAVEQFDVKNKAWISSTSKVAIHLEPGAAALYRVTPKPQAGH
jgi:hypothetical protein